MRLQEHLPPLLRGVAEYAALCEAVEAELTALRTGIEAVRRNLVISTAEEEGLSRWEEMLSLYGGGSLADRRSAVLARTARELPYTMETLHHRLRGIVGEHGYVINASGMSLHVLLSLEAQSAFSAVCEMLRDIVPSSVSVTVEVKLTRYQELTPHTHGEFSQYTHEMIRNEVATNDDNNPL